MKYWFESQRDPLPESRGSRLRRIALESQEQDEGRIQRWLDLAKKLFDGDDDSGPEAA
jgi:hypothetical protein